MYAASQPGKCGPTSSRQLIKIEIADNSDPYYVFVYGPKPVQGTTIRVDGKILDIQNFYEPVVSSGFRNMREGFATSTDTCYDGGNCPVPVVQTTVSNTVQGSTTIDPPVQVAVESVSQPPPPLPPPVETTVTTIYTPFGSSSSFYEAPSTVTTAAAPPPPTKPAPILLAPTTTVTSVPPADVVIVPPATISVLQTAYLQPRIGSSSSSARRAPPTQPSIGSSSSYAYTTSSSGGVVAIGGAGATSGTGLRAGQAQPYRKQGEQAQTAPKSTEKTVKTVVKTVVAKPGAECKTEPEDPYYNPKAGLIANLFGEIVHDFGKVINGVKYITS